MTKLTYIGAHDAVDTPWGVAVRGGDPLDIPAESVDELVDRGDFARPTTKAAAKAADLPHSDLAVLAADPAPAEEE